MRHTGKNIWKKSLSVRMNKADVILLSDSSSGFFFSPFYLRTMIIIQKMLSQNCAVFMLQCEHSQFLIILSPVSVAITIGNRNQEWKTERMSENEMTR